MKLAILIIGQMRTFNNLCIIESYKRFLNNLGTIDVYINTWSKKGFSNNHGNKNYPHNYCDDLVDTETIEKHYSKVDFFNIVNIEIEDFETWVNNLDDKLKAIYNTPFRYHSKNTTSVCVEYKYQKGINQMVKYKKNDYDYVLIMRPDTELLDYVPFNSYKLNSINYHSFHPRCADHSMCCDEKTAIKVYSTIFDNYLINHSEIPFKINEGQDNSDNNELIIHQATKNNVELHYQRKFLFRIIYTM